MRLKCGKCDNGWICEEHPDLRRAGCAVRELRVRLQHHRNWSQQRSGTRHEAG